MSERAVALSPTAGLTGVKGERAPSAGAPSGSERGAGSEGDVLLAEASGEKGENARRGEAGLGLASQTCTPKVYYAKGMLQHSAIGLMMIGLLYRTYPHNL